MNNIHFERTQKLIRTIGFKQTGMDEICLEIEDSTSTSDAENLLRYVLAYVEQAGCLLLPGETLQYGYWLVKFQAERGCLDVWEYNANATDFVRGGSLAMRYWRKQHDVCERYQALFLPPRPDRLTVVDEGVFRGLPVQAVRYPSPNTCLVGGSQLTHLMGMSRHFAGNTPTISRLLAPMSRHISHCLTGFDLELTAMVGRHGSIIK